MFELCLVKVSRQMSLTHFLSVTPFGFCSVLQMLGILSYKATIGR